MRKLLFISATVCLGTMVSCAGNGDVARAEQSIDTSMKSTEALAMERLMRDAAGKGIMFGHQDDMSYGLGWTAVPWESDVRRVTGSYPAVFGWDIGRIGSTHNIDSVSFDSMKVYISRVHEMGGINTVSWHAFLPHDSINPWYTADTITRHLLPGGKYHKEFKDELDLVADFFNACVDKNGVKIPILFRPWHEMDGGWFWWGVKHTSREEYKALFRFTIDYLRKEKGLRQLLVGFSTDCKFNNIEEYLQFYPGDEYVDLMGMDNYWEMQFTGDTLQQPINKLMMVVREAKKRDKLVAMTETGFEGLGKTEWYTKNLNPVINANDTTRQISYVLVWRNFSTKHHYAPYPGSPAAPDFMEWVGQDNIWLLNDLQEFRKK